MQAHKKLSPNKERFTREIPVLLQGFTREKIDIILGLGCEKPYESLYYLGGIPYLNIMNRTISYLNTLTRTIPYLNTLSRTIPYLNTLSRFIPYLNKLNRTIPYLKTLSRNIPYLNTLSRTKPYLNTLTRLHSDFDNSSRQPIRIEYYVTRVVCQSESSITSLGSQSNSSITSPELSTNQNRVLRHPRALGYA